jgi:hypothetical protein
VIRKFLEGLVFGAGFTIAVGLVAWLGLGLLTPVFFARSAPVISSGVTTTAPEPDTFPQERGPAFHELPLDEQIRQASVIAIARYEPAPDGQMKAVIKEFLKNDPDTTLYYKIGDEYASGSFYPEAGAERGDGIVIFFQGSPAGLTMSMNYSGDRIPGLGDIPMALFREKCANGK